MFKINCRWRVGGWIACTVSCSLGVKLVIAAEIFAFGLIFELVDTRYGKVLVMGVLRHINTGINSVFN